MSVVARSPKKIQNRFALRFMPSVRQDAERVLADEGVSLNQFINVAVAEKVARMQHERWVANRRPFDEAARADLLDLLDRNNHVPPEPGDEIPASYLAWRESELAKSKPVAGPQKSRKQA